MASDDRRHLIQDISSNVAGAWDEFCLCCDDAWFWHTTSWLEYCVAYGQQRRHTVNISFSVSDDVGLLAVCPLLLERDDRGRLECTMSGGGYYGVMPALRNGMSEDRREKICRRIFEEIDVRAARHGVQRVSIRTSPLVQGQYRFNTLMKYGYLDATVNTQLLSLDRAPEELWSLVRKGHKYDINRGRKAYGVELFDAGSIKWEISECYRELHRKAAGRVTRPLETFRMMHEWVTRGNGLLCAAKDGDRYVGFAYVVLYKDGAYYASASDDPDHPADIPTSHVIQWNIIQWLSEHGFRKYEIGMQQFGPQLQDIPTDKDRSISFFKRGFGGETLPVFRGDRFYNLDYLQEALGGNVQRLLRAMQQPSS